MFAAAYWKHGCGSTARDERIRRASVEAVAKDADLTDPDTRAEARSPHSGLLLAGSGDDGIVSRDLHQGTGRGNSGRN